MKELVNHQSILYSQYFCFFLDECGNEEHEDIAQDINSGLSATNKKKSRREEDDPSEDEVEILAGGTDTMLTATDSLGDIEYQYDIFYFIVIFLGHFCRRGKGA